MKKAKRLFAALLACLMVVGLLPLTALANPPKEVKVAGFPTGTYFEDGNSHPLVSVTYEPSGKGDPEIQYHISLIVYAPKEYNEIKGDSSKWDSTLPELSSAGTYYVYYKVADSNGYKKAEGKDAYVTTVIDKTEKFHVTVSGVTVEKTGEAQNIVSVSYSDKATKTPEIYYYVSKKELKQNEFDKLSSESWKTEAEATDPGEYFVYYYVTDKDDFVPVAKSKDTFVKSKITKKNVKVTANDFIADGELHDLVIMNDTQFPGKVLYYASKTRLETEQAKDAIKDGKGGFEEKIPQAKEPGTYYVYYHTHNAGKDYEEVAHKQSIEVVVTVSEKHYEAPTPNWLNADLETAQDFVNEGSVSEGKGTMYYAIGKDGKTAPEEGWNTSVPSEIISEVETRYVWYKVVGTSSLYDVEPQVVAVESYKLPTAAEGLVYNGMDQELLSKAGEVSNDKVYQLIYKRYNGSDYTDYQDVVKKNAGEVDIYVYAEKIDNHQQEERVKLGVVPTKIEKASLIKEAPEAVNEYVKYSSFDHELTGQKLITKGEIDGWNGAILYALGTKDKAPEEDWSHFRPEGKYAGEYYVWYKVVSTNDNYADVEPTLVTSELKPVVILPKAKKRTLTYNADDQELLREEGYVLGYKDEYVVVYSSQEEEGWHRNIENVTGRDAGIYTIRIGVTKARWPHICEDNVIVVDDTSVQKEINKLNVTLTPVDTGKVYGQKDSTVEFDFTVDFPDDGHEYEPIEFEDVKFVREEGEDVKYVEDDEEVIYDSYMLGLQLVDGAEKNYPNYYIASSTADFVITPYNLEDAESFGIELSGFVLEYDNTAKTQPIKENVEVFEAGENLQSLDDDITYNLSAADYEVVGNRAVENGIYKLSIKAKEKGNYIGAQKIDYKTWVILKDNNDFENKEFKGSVEIAEVTQKGAKEAEWALSNADIVKAVSLAEEVSNAADGSELEIWLDSDVANVSADEKAAIAKAAPNKTVLEYIDLKIFTRLDDGEKIQVKNLNKKVAISIPLDDNQISTDATVKRTYNIVQSHDDENNLLDVEYNKEAKKITFVSDKFSVYTPVYQDVVTPKTVDGGNTWLFVVIATLAMAALVYFGMTMKKRETK